jgi:undecaprenyl diphosphate synthase
LKKIPQHIAIIMDGNGRWAKRRGLPKIMGHRAGVKSAQEAIEAAKDMGVKFITLYTFSTENWKRPKEEVSALFKLLQEYIEREGDKLRENNVRFSVIGRIDELPETVAEGLTKLVRDTAGNTGIVVNLAINYGSRAEILDAVRAVALDAKSGKMDPSDIDEKTFSGYLYTHDIPDPDLLIRTSGEFRVSNFLLWQISYSELYVTKKLWPDFRKDDLRKAVKEYRDRDRRYGG